jgi:hypothetical protein
MMPRSESSAERRDLWDWGAAIIVSMRAAFLSCVMIVVFACAHAPAIQLPPTGSDEYDVYQTVLALEPLSRARGIWLLSETTGGGKERPDQAADAPPPSAVSPSHEQAVDIDFRSAYQSAARLPAERIDARRLTLPKEVQFVEKVDGPWWAAGHTIVAVSRVGFDSEHRRAVIFVDMVCGSLCGRGQIIELQRVGESWSIVKRIGTWIA